MRPQSWPCGHASAAFAMLEARRYGAGSGAVFRRLELLDLKGERADAEG
jgi:hypothetical protein